MTHYNDGIGEYCEMIDREKTALGIREMLMRDTWRDIDANRSRYQHILNDALAMMKEQEAVKPGKEHSSSGVTWWNVCGNCKTAINPNDKFCHECGKPILWEGR